jgi:GTP-binding protein
MTQIRNIAIIAHVDHGKTTLVDGLLKQSNTFRDNQAEMSQSLIMDSGDQEKERGITITAKITAVEHDDLRINIIDTPGHADFSGEVERTLNMADGCLLIVDAQEGPMPQTKFVLKKALEGGLKPIVVINKIDKNGSRIAEVEDEVANLFLELAVSDDQLHYKTFYAIGREGKAWAAMPTDPEAPGDLSVLFTAIETEIPAPDVDPAGEFQFLVNALSWDNYQGKYAIGRITRGKVKARDQVVLIKAGVVSKIQLDKIYVYKGLARFEVTEAIAGDIVCLTGVKEASIGDTLASVNAPDALPTITIAPPTLKMSLGPNTSPFKGQEGEFSTSRQIGERLDRELETNVGLKVESEGIGFLISGRGELHLSVLIEAMRREGYEFEVGRPQVVTTVIDGKIMEPVEELNVEISPEFVGAVQMELGARRAELISQKQSSKGVSELVYKIPTRALLGLRNTMMTATKGTIIMNSLMTGYEELGQALPQLRNGVLIAFETGTTTPYALVTAEERGTCFVGPGVKVYAGQVIGLNLRSEDMEINVAKEKALTNMRSKSSDGTTQLTPFTDFSLEQCLDFIENDELLEVTPKSLRLRKRELNPSLRKKR